MTAVPDPLRSRTMRAVKSKNTKPEMTVRRLIHRLGYRYRIHREDLPGSPDLVFASRRKVIFVHGYFWHGHDCERGRRQPKTNANYWCNKIQRNRDRDNQAVTSLAELGSESLVIWECELRDAATLASRCVDFLGLRSRDVTLLSYRG